MRLLGDKLGFLGTMVLYMAIPNGLLAQCNGWQQRVEYSMDVDLDVRTHRYSGTTALVYRNNSPDTLYHVFFHLYPNAFRPGSEMDVRSRTIKDPDSRIDARISELESHQMGELVVGRMNQQGKVLTLEQHGTVLKVELAKALLPGKSTTLEFSFNGQVPIQIRRSGRNNNEGVAYTMTQWFPKLAEYDQRGWHADPYVAREFFGVWGDFDVRITMDSAYTIAATGELKNPSEIGHGYPLGNKALKRPVGDRLTWRFVAKDVHDFAWAADPDYVHTVERVSAGGPELHFFHKKDAELAAVWKDLPGYMVKALAYMNEHHGTYPWPCYSFVQGGDGGMEYPMLTMISGKRRLGSLVGVSVHEFVHSWYHGMMASNEGRYPWMDEGFTQYAASNVMQHLFQGPEDPHSSAYMGYEALTSSSQHEPPSIHADHFITNFAYGVTAYNFGELLVNQLGAVIGEKTLANGLLRYTEACKFKHPEPIDLERVMEKVSGMELDWYFDEWINTTRQLDYGIQRILEVNGKVEVTLVRHGDMLMPIEVEFVNRSGGAARYFIPISLMLETKRSDAEAYDFATLPAWQWTDPTYSFSVPGRIAELSLVSLDPTLRTADIDRSNDRIELPVGTGGFIRP